MNPPSRVVNWQRFYAPRSVAIVGATDDTTRFGGRLLRQMSRWGYAGRVLPVNPKRAEINGVTCYPSVLDLPETPDHVGIVVPAERVLSVLQDCHARGVECATVFTAGFAETNTPRGRALQDEVAAFARKSGLRVMGPNCNGIVNFVDRFAMSGTLALSNMKVPPGEIGIVSQSGGLGQVNVMWRAIQAGVRVSYQASVGNEADLTAVDFARFMVESEVTQVIIMALEAVRDGAAFLRLAEFAAQNEKPIVLMKFGRTEMGVRAAASHTGAMAGSDDVFDAACRQFGLIRVQDCYELYETAIALRGKRWPKGRRAASLSLSGGNVVQMADIGSDLGLVWSEYTAETKAKLAELIPGFGKVENPTDMTSTATSRPGLYRSALDIIYADSNVDVMIPAYTFANKADLEHAAELSAKGSKPLVMVWTGGCSDDEAFDAEACVARGAAAYHDTSVGLAAVRAAIGYREFLESRRARDAMVRPTDLRSAEARAMLAAQPGRSVTERVSKQILATYGLPPLREELAVSAEQAVKHAKAIGFPVALKIESPDIAHKTEAKAVRLALHDEPSVREAYAEVMAAARAYNPAATLNGVLVQEMVDGGVELILGFVRDPVLGPVIAVGFGGVHAELFKDVTYRVPPIDHDEARRMLRDLRAYKMLEGLRGKPPSDVQALTECIVRLSWFANDLADMIEELDVNPLIALPSGTRMVDALIVKRVCRA